MKSRILYDIDTGFAKGDRGWMAVRMLLSRNS